MNLHARISRVCLWRIAAVIATLALASLNAHAQSSAVTQNGVDRAQAVTLDCLAAGTTIAVPCGTVGNPLVVAVGGMVIGQLAPVAAPLVSRTITVAAGQSTVLFSANAQRRYLSFQAPQTTGIWVNRVGGIASANGADCAYFPPGALFESGGFVNSGAVTVYSPNAVTIAAWEG